MNMPCRRSYLSFYGGPYGLYILFGYFCDRKKLLRGVGAVRPAFIAALSGTCCVLWHMLVGDVWYTNVFCLGLTVPLLELVLRQEDKVATVIGRAPCEVARFVSRASFGVYLCHMPISQLIAAVTVPVFAQLPGALLLFALTALASAAFVAVLWRPSWLRALLFDAK